jgi:hypothetical protein
MPYWFGEHIPWFNAGSLCIRDAALCPRCRADLRARQRVLECVSGTDLRNLSWSDCTN